MKNYYRQICGPNLPQITYKINGFRKYCVEAIVLRKSAQSVYFFE